MWINRIIIKQFGNLKNFDMSFDSQLNVIAAPNEAGKSTLIDFIFASLYGMDSNDKNVRRSNRSRNMPWGENTMGGLLELKNEKTTYHINSHFGKTRSFDERSFQDLGTGKTIEYEAQDEIGLDLFGLPQSSFSQSVYVRQMALVLDTKEVARGRLTQSLTNLSTTGTADVSSNQVNDILKEQKYYYTNRSRKYAVLPALKTQLNELRDKHQAAIGRERAEAEALAELSVLENKQRELRTQVGLSIANEKRTSFLIDSTQLLQNLNRERKLGERDENLTLQTQNINNKLSEYQVEGLDQFETDYQDIMKQHDTLAFTIKQMNDDERALDKKRIELRAKQEEENRVAEAAKQERQNLRQSLTELDEKNRSDQARKAQLEQELNNMGDAPEEPSLKDQKKVKQLLFSGIGLAALGLILFLVIFLIRNFACIFTILGFILGLVLIYFSIRTKKQNEAATQAFTAYMQKYNRETEQLERINHELELTKETRQNLNNRIEEIDSENKTFLIAKGTFDDSYDTFIKRRSALNDNLIEFVEQVNQLCRKHTYLQLSPHLRHVALGESFTDPPPPDDLTVTDPALAEIAFENASKRLEDLKQRANKWSSFIKDLENEASAIKLEYNLLKENSNDATPSDRWQERMKEAQEQGYPSSEAEIKKAINEEPYPDQLSRSLQLREHQTEQLRQKLDNVTQQHSQKKAYIKTYFREVERSENISREIEETIQKISQAEAYIRSLDYAAEALDQAREDMRRYFTKPLREMTTEYLAFLTADRYDQVTVDESMQMMVQIAGDSMKRKAEYMSGGTYDQIYLALRLAIADLLVDPEKNMPPLILDDVFTQFDDARTSRGLQLLHKVATDKNRQVLLFTCRDVIKSEAQELGFAAPTFPSV